LQTGCRLKTREPLKTLENRLNGIQEVSGSIPLISTMEESPETLEKSGASGLFLFSEHLRKSLEKY